jgi:hypothetical protein
LNATFCPNRLQASGQSETAAKSTDNKVNGRRAAENAGQESAALKGVNNRLLTKVRHP